MVKRRIHGDVQDRIEGLTWANPTWTSAQIFRAISEDPKFTAKMVHKRTVERIVKEIRVDDASERWNLASSDGEDARLVLEAKEGYFFQYGRNVEWISKEAADWIVRILRAVPDLPREIAWLVGQVYRSKVNLEKDTRDIDDYLTFAPWRSPDHYRLYYSACELGQIGRPPLWELLVEEHNPDLSWPEKKGLISRRRDLSRIPNKPKNPEFYELIDRLWGTKKGDVDER